MRNRIMALALATLAGLGAGAAKAGVLELLVDDISKERFCEVEPCRGNDLENRTQYVKDHYRRYHIESAPAVYELREVEIRSMPPKVVLHERPGRYDWVAGKRLLVATPAEKVELEASTFETVTTPVLVAPAKHRVIREQPYYAYYPDRIVVVGGGCGRPGFALRC